MEYENFDKVADLVKEINALERQLNRMESDNLCVFIFDTPFTMGPTNIFTKPV